MTEKEEEKIIKLLEKKNYNEVIKICNEILNTNNEDEIAYFYRGVSRSSVGQYKEAIEDYDKAIELNPNNSSYYNSRGISKVRLIKYDKDIKGYNEAINDYNKATELNPNNEKAHYNKGLAKARLKLYEESVDCYDKAIDLNQEYFKAYFNRYISQYNLKEYEKAIKDYKKLIDVLRNKLTEKCEFDIRFIVNLFIDIMRIVDIEDIFKLIKENYKELFENDTIFKLLKNKIKSKDISNKYDIFNNVKEILFYQHLLLKSLSFNINDNIEISHYTSLKLLLLLLSDTKEYKNKEDEGKIRIVNISNANDPKEGKILESIFNKNGLDIKISDNEENLITLQTSYTRNKDSLTMFRLYGKNENKEATGICLVIDKEYFNDKYFSTPVQESSILTNDKNSNENEEEQIDNLKRNLFWILYYNEKENKLIFSSEDSKYKNIIIDLKNMKNLKNKDRFKKNKITLKNKKEIIEYIFSNIYYYAKELDKKIKDKNLKNEIFSNLFENIKYLIKDEAFFEEQELRILITTNYEGREIKIDNYNKRLYINYMKLFDENDNYINEIILGSKVENAESIVEYIKKVLSNKYSKEIINNKDIKVSISKAPLR